MRVLVTGANGFVGRQLCEKLTAIGHEVIGAVRHRSPNLENMPIRLVEVGNIGSETDWRDALEGVESVMHVAARTHVMCETAADPDALYREVNVDGTERLAKQALTAGVSRFLFVSSVKAGGERSIFNYPLRAESRSFPEDAYGRTKRDAEKRLLDLSRDTDMEAIILCPPLVYGPGIKGNMLTLFEAVWKGVPLPLKTVRNRRDLIFVGNLVDAMIRILTSSHVAGKTFYISDGDAVSIGELLTRIGVALGRPARLFPFPVSLIILAGWLSGKSATICRVVGSLQVDSTPIRESVGWQPPFTMKQGLALTAAWFTSRTDG